MGPMMMRMMFSLMDADGDGKLSLQEFQAAHERIFKAMDARFPAAHNNGVLGDAYTQRWLACVVVPQ